MKISVLEICEFMECQHKSILRITEILNSRISELEKQASAQDGIIIILKQQRDDALKAVSTKKEF